MSFYSAISNSRGLTYYPPVPFFESIESFSPLFHGWFGLRKLDDSYTGDCIRIRRGSDDAETDIGFDGKHLDLQAIHNFCVGTTGYVVAWYDQAVGIDSTVGGLAENEFPSVQPIIYANGDIIRSGPSNAPSIRFFGGKFLEFAVDEGSTSGLDADGRSTSIVCNVLDAVGPVFKGKTKTGETGDAYGLYIDSTTAKIEIKTDEIVYDLQDYGQNDLIIVSTIHRGDNFFESTPEDATLEKDSLIINGDYLEVNTPPSGVTVVDGSKTYYIGGFSNNFNGYVSEFIFIKSGITSISSPEHLRRVNGNQSLYYQQQDPAALPTINNDVDAIYFVDYGTLDYTPVVGLPPYVEYTTRTIQGFNVPVELSFNYDDTTVQLYYRIDNVGITPSPSGDPFSGLTAIDNGASIIFTEPKNLTLACEFSGETPPVDLEIKNVTDSNTLSGTATLNNTDYVIQLNIAQETFSATTNSGLFLDGFTTTNAGDLLLLLIAHDDTGDTTFTDVLRLDTFGSAGFTKLTEVGTSSQAVHVGIFYKIADGTEDGIDYYVGNLSQGSANFVGWGLRIDNANTDEGWLNTFTSETDSGASVSIAGVGGISGANNNEILFVAYDGGGGTPITTNQWTTTPFDDDKQLAFPNLGPQSITAGWDLIKSFDDTSTPSVNVTFGDGSVSDGVAAIRLVINAATEESNVSSPLPTLPTPDPIPAATITDVRRFLSGDPNDWSDPTSGSARPKVGLPTYSAGDTVIIFMATSDTFAGNNINTPTGWTRLTPQTTEFGDTTSDADVAFFARQMNGSEGTSFEWDVDASGTFTRNAGISFTVQGYSGTSQYSTPNTSQSAIATAIPITASADSVIFTYIAFDGSDGEPFTMTNAANVTYDSSEDFSTDSGQVGFAAGVFWGNISSGTYTGNVSIQCSSNDGFIVGHLLLNS